MKFAKVVFYAAGAWGVVVLVPLYFALEVIGRQNPPPVTHPEYYFGFLGVALMWQFAFFIIAGDPVRFRPMMLATIAEKLVHVGAMAALWLKGRINAGQFAVNLPDLLLGVLFIIAFCKTPRGFSASQ